jgi:hypothetical protein
MTTDLGRAERHAIEIQALAGEIAARLPAALEMLKAYKRGYPTGGDGSGDGTSRTEALGISPPDAIDREERELAHALERALRELNVAYNITARYQRPRRDRKPGRTIVSLDDGWCSSCQRDGDHLEPVWDGRYRNLCRWCAEFTLAEGCEPPLSLLRLRHQGKRITADMVDRELARTGGRRAGSGGDA